MAVTHRLLRYSKGIYLRLILLAVGVGAIAWLIHETGGDAVRGALLQASAVIPLLLLLEGGRIASEGLATRRLARRAGQPGTTASGGSTASDDSTLRPDAPKADIGTASRSGELPWRTLIRAQLISYSVCTVAPAGRTAGEALKGVMLTPYIGSARAALIATTMQALTLLSNGTMALAAATMSFMVLGSTTLSWALVAYAGITLSGGMLVQALSRSRRLSTWLIGLRPKLRRPIGRFRRAARHTAYVPWVPAALLLGGRMLQALQFGILAGALGLGFGIQSTLLSQGLNMVSAAVGDLVPAQIGVTDSAFAMAAGNLGTTAAVGLSMAVLIHCVQLSWVALGATIPLFFRERGDRTRRDRTPRHPQGMGLSRSAASRASNRSRRATISAAHAPRCAS